VNGFGGAQEKQPGSLQKEVLENCEFQLIYVLKVQKWWQNGKPTQLTVIQLIATPCHLLKKILSTKTMYFLEILEQQ
jgi:hypothetical protein